MSTHTLPSPLPPRPVRPARLTAPRPVRRDGETVMEEREVQIQEQDARIISHLAENGIATRRILAYLCGASEENAERKMDSLRKRLNTLTAAGVLSVQGTDRGSQTIYQLTDLGHHYYPGSDLPGRFLPDLDESTLLNVSGVVARVSAPRSESFFHQIPAGSLSIGLPVLSRARITCDAEQMLGKPGVSNRAQQTADAQAWLASPDYPTVQAGWSIDQLTASQAEEINAFFRNGFRSTHGAREWVMPGYLVQTLDEYGNPKAVVDFVIPLPHIAQGSKRYLGSMGCLVEVGRRTDAELRTRLALVANSPVQFGKIVVFIPDSQTGVAKAVREQWNLLLREGFVDGYESTDLVIRSYTPVNAPSGFLSLSTPDRQVAVKHFGRG